MDDGWTLISALATGTFAIRFAGARLGQAIPTQGAAARALNALPGCLIVSLVAVSMLTDGWREWTAGALALVVAVITRNVPVTMAFGIASVWALRHWA